MYVIGMRRYARAVYPTSRGPASAQGAIPFAQLGLSADAPFTDADTLIIPFDRIIYQSGSFGELETIGGVSIFGLPFGAYLGVLQVEVDTTPTKIDGLIEIASNTAGDVGGLGSSSDRFSASVSAIRAASETPIPGQPQPCAVQPVVTVTGGGNGNVLATVTKMFIWQLAAF